MNIIEQFDTKHYVKIPGVLDPDICLKLASDFNDYLRNGNGIKDTQCDKSESSYGYPEFERLLVNLLPLFEEKSGKRLMPTYSYARRYARGEVLKNHIDRPSCEISATITLAFSGNPWSIFMGNHDKSISSEIFMDVGDAVLYKGQQVNHWREEFDGDWQVQVFLHYVDADGPNTEWIYDKREKLNLVDETQQIAQEIYCFYDDILNQKACDILINTYTNPEIKRLQPFIGNGTIDKDIRNVERVSLPTYKDIGGRLAAVGLSANFNRWKFDITNSDQAEFLIYPAGGKYTTHIDTFIVPGQVCRKLTVLAFLNDDFEGGKFFLWVGDKKIYPPQKPGTIIVFPSFIPHGVEDILSGERYSVVCWMDGPWFK